MTQNPLFDTVERPPIDFDPIDFVRQAQRQVAKVKEGCVLQAVDRALARGGGSMVHVYERMAPGPLQPDDDGRMTLDVQVLTAIHDGDGVGPVGVVLHPYGEWPE